jgi:hypothetical protein
VQTVSESLVYSLLSVGSSPICAGTMLLLRAETQSHGLSSLPVMMPRGGHWTCNVPR